MSINAQSTDSTNLNITTAINDDDDNTGEDVILAAVEGGGTTFRLTIARLLPPSTTLSSSSSSSSSIIIEIGKSKLQILANTTISSSTIPPTETLKQCASFFRTHAAAASKKKKKKNYYNAIGIATFGPVGLNKENAETYGRILPSSPKKEWRNVDVVSPILNACRGDDDENDDDVPPHLLETDVNAPAWAEYVHRNHIYTNANSNNNNKKKKKSISSVAYITVGTGVGVGLVINHKPVHGLMHPEGGHATVAPLEPNDTFKGYSWGKERSPYGGVNTVEGVASSVALTERLVHLQQQQQQHQDGTNNNDNGTGEKKDGSTEEEATAAAERESLKDLPDTHILWSHASNALANLCTSLVLLTSVEQIILGGGIMNRTILYDQIRTKTREILNGYLDLKEVMTMDGLKEYICASSWGEGDRGGLVGALALALDAYDRENNEKEDEEEEERGLCEEQENGDKGEKDDRYQRGMMMGATIASSIMIVSAIGFTLMMRRRGG